MKNHLDLIQNYQHNVRLHFKIAHEFQRTVT